MKFEVLPGHSVVADKPYLPGETLELSDKEGQRLTARKIVKPVKEAPPRSNAKDTIRRVEAAESIKDLDELAEGEDRDTVLKAIEKRRAELAG